MGYQKSPAVPSGSFRRNGGFGGSGGSGGFGGSGGSCGSVGNGGSKGAAASGVNLKDKKITPIKDVDPMLDDIAVQARCISIFHSHKLNAAHDPYSLDIVLQDAQNSRIQVYIKKEFMYKFEPLFEEGQCYMISNFGIAENGGKLPLLPHRFKISFYRNTIVTRVEPFDNNTHGFIFEPFNYLHDPVNHQYFDNDAVDVIGSVVGIGDIVPVMSASGKKVRRTVVVEDAEANPLNLTFWDSWASMWDQYASKRESIGHLVIILQLGKVKYWDGDAAVHNALFGTKIYINQNLPEIKEFRTRVQERDGFDAKQLKIEVFTPEQKVVTVSEFFHRSVKKMIGGIRECDPDSHCIVYATIHRLHREEGWAYTACKQCNKRVNVVDGRNRKTAFVCEDHGSVQVASRFKVIVRLIDETGSAPVVFFNNNFCKLSGYTAWALMEQYGMDPDDYWPNELDSIVGKKCLFKIYFSEYNVNYNNHTYRCDSFSENGEFINHFKKDFFEEDTTDDVPEEVPTDEFNTPATLIKKINMADSSVTRQLDLQTPPTTFKSSGSSSGSVSKKNRVVDLESPFTTCEASGSSGSSGSKKRRVVVDLDDIDSEPEDESTEYDPDLVQVKIEPED